MNSLLTLCFTLSIWRKLVKTRPQNMVPWFLFNHYNCTIVDMRDSKLLLTFCFFNCRLNNWFFGLHRFWFHLGNVLLHAVCSGLFTRIALAVVGLQMRFAALAGVLFASHPIHTEAVTMTCIHLHKFSPKYRIRSIGLYFFVFWLPPYPSFCCLLCILWCI